jgi:hypothetical protein
MAEVLDDGLAETASDSNPTNVELLEVANAESSQPPFDFAEHRRGASEKYKAVVRLYERLERPMSDDLLELAHEAGIDGGRAHIYLPHGSFKSRLDGVLLDIETAERLAAVLADRDPSRFA